MSRPCSVLRVFTRDGGTTIDQGEEIGHPSRIELVWEGKTASIGGTVALVGSRELSW